jgi:putrescine importer
VIVAVTETAVSDDTRAPGQHELRRTLRLGGVVLFGLAYIAPMSVFAIYGELDQLSRGTPAGAYLLALGAIALTALSYGRMVTIYPVAGSAYTYVRRTISDPIGFLVGWAAVLDYLLLPMAAWLISAVFLAPAIPGVPIWVWIIVIGGCTTAVNIVGLVLANRVNIVLVAFEMLVIAAFVALAIRYVWLGSGPGGLVSVEPFF